MASLKVAVRVRPYNQREIDMGAKLIVQMDGKKTRLNKSKIAARELGRDNHNDFTFDYSYWSYDDNDSHYATQEQVYNDLGTDVLECAFQGYNACVFAYGQTGSGKTFTMMGTPESQGLIPRICRSLFSRIKLGQEAGTGYKTHVSYLEIYNERVKDLLGPHSVGHGLRVREHRTMGPYVENLSQHSVADYDEIQECIMRGNVQRTTASTNMNDTSSRSHAIFTITFVQAGFLDEMPSETVSKIHLVDLAGSERANATGATGQRLKEGAHINKSLVTLGSVISALAEQTNPTNNKRILYIPYRDSVLTWLLKDSLGGNSKTIMIAAISPADCNYGETLSTLRYANRAKNIINKPTINEDPNVKLIRELREEITKLKSMLTSESDSLEESSSKVLEDLQKKEAQEKVLTEEWTEKWREAQMILREQKTLGLRKSGVGVVLDSEQPHLIGIHDDISTGVTLYSLKEGETYIGTDECHDQPDIVLTGTGIYPEHCSIVLYEGIATIYPKPPALCWLNANLIEEPTGISQGDILLLGRTNMFRFNNPAEAAKLRRDPQSRSRLDLSRLSLIAASRENLNSSFIGDDDTPFSSPFKREKQYCPSELFSREDAELQDEHKKILETIENALKQLTLERSQMHEQYKIKVKKLAENLDRLVRAEKDKIAILDCKEQELLARREMLLWEMNSEKIEVDIVARQISALQTQLDSKKRDFYEYAAKELQELLDCGKLDELNIKITESTPLSDDSSEVLLDVSKSLDNFSAQFIRDTVKKNRDEIIRIEKELEQKEALLNDSNEKMIDLDSRLSQLEKEAQIISTEKISYDIEVIQQKKQSLSLNLKTTTDSDAQTETPDIRTTDTCETYHTANSDWSATSSFSSVPCGTSTNQILNGSQINLKEDNEMSDSGVSLETQKTNEKLSTTSQVVMSTPKINQDRMIKFDADETNSGNNDVDDDDDDIISASSSCETTSAINFKNIYQLRQEIATQKALIMKSLESDNDRNHLDEQIAYLQELQKQYIKLEIELQQTGKYEERVECCLSDGEITLDSARDIPESIAGSDENRLHQLPQSSLLRNRNNLYESTYAPSVTRSLPSIGAYQESEHTISVPSFIIRGAGKQTHYEYEVRINLVEERWILLRRYSRFRELHLSMKNCYGEKISAIPFPRRELFSSKSESVARQRRRQLESYMRRLLVVCAKIPQCPIFEGPGGVGLTKASLVEFSSFFRKGLFESGKHGTG